MSNLEEFKKEVETYLSANPDGWFIQDNGIRNADEVAEDIIDIAVAYGFIVHDMPSLEDDDDYSETIDWIMDEAIDYLSGGVPEGYWIGNDGYAGGFGIWRSDE